MTDPTTPPAARPDQGGPAAPSAEGSQTAGDEGAPVSAVTGDSAVTGNSAVTAQVLDDGTASTTFPLLTGRGRSAPFQVHLDVFEGPFDLLLGLIGKHKLDITEVALAKVTDEFVAHIRANGTDWDLGQASEFLVVAATLLDLKAARLLPSATVEDEEDLALLEARDLLFARLLQYRAFKQVADVMAQRMADASRRHARAVSLEPHFASLLPELVMSITPEQLAVIAARALAPKPVPTVGLEHLHAPAVSVREQAAVIVGRLRRQRSLTFRTLTSDADTTLVVVARFLALLELFRDGSVAFEQVTPLGELTIRWTGSDSGDVAVSDEFDERTSPATDEPPGSDEPQPDESQPDESQPDEPQPDEPQPDEPHDDDTDSSPTQTTEQT